jgi:serine/threonine protein kinase
VVGSEGYRAPRDPLIGQIVQERYRIVHAIGRGAMGVVYEAQHLLIGRKVALKTMAAHAVSPAGVQRFRREAQAAAAVGNSHIVDVLDMGRLEDGSLYIVMEHLDGFDLGFAVALEQRFSVGRAVHVLGQLCDALSAIHAAGIIHRDLKPENIFLTTRDGSPDFVKVLDFGVCKVNQANGGRLTATGDTIGTPLFMAPEQVEGRTDCDQRADIYALGALLYFVLTGRAPFDAPSLPALFLRICHEPAPSLRSADSGLSFELDAIVQRALNKDPNARFDSCGAFKAALRSLQATPDEVAATLPSAVHDRRTSGYAFNRGGSLIRSQRRRPRWLGLGVLGVAALAVSISPRAYLERARERTPAVTQASAQAPQHQVEPAPVLRERMIPVVEVVSERVPRQQKNTAFAAALPPKAIPIEQPALLPPSLPSAAPKAAADTHAGSAQQESTPAPSTSASSSSAKLHLTRGLKHDL